MSRIDEIKELFVDHWGEDRVDFQREPYGGWSIIVWYPEVTVENEDGGTHVVKDLYFRIIVDDEGKMLNDPKAKRTTFTRAEWESRYIHSHVYPGDMNMNTWHDLCFGRGPLRTTCAELCIGYDQVEWELFVSELDAFTEVESLEGGPWSLMSKIGEGVSDSILMDPGFARRNDLDLTCFAGDYHKLIRRFILWLSDHCIDEVVVRDGVFMFKRLGYDLREWMSEEFARFYNATKDRYGITRDMLNDIATLASKVGIYWYNIGRVPSLENMNLHDEVLVFKGESKHLNFEDVGYDDTAINQCYILNIEFVNAVNHMFSALMCAVYNNATPNSLSKYLSCSVL